VSPRVGAALRRTFSSARSSRNFRLYLIGQIVSATGTWMNFTASSWLVLQLSGSGTALGVNAALSFGPVLLLGPFGGVLADRFDKRRILVATQMTYAVIALTIFALVITTVIQDAAQLWMVYALSLASGIVTAFDNPARQSFYVEMVGEDALTNAVSLNSAAFTGSRIIGPAIAGLLIASVGRAWPFLVDGVSYLAVIVALLAMRSAEMHQHRRTTRERGHLRAGLRYVWQTPALRRPLLILAVVFTVSFQFQVLVPLLAERVFGGDAGTFGALSAVAGLGSFLGAITMAHRNQRPTMRVLALLVVGFGAALLLVGAAPILGVAFVLMVPLGYVSMAFMITGNTMLQLNARPEARGRVMALYGAIFLGSTPIGSPAMGWFADQFGVRSGFFLAGAASLVTGLVVLYVRRRTLDSASALAADREPEPAVASAG
jgi:MFS family permease